MPYEVRLTIFIILCVIVFALLIFWIAYPLIKKKILSARYKQFYYRYVERVVNYNDYYLINNLSFDAGDSKTLTIDHLIGGNKFIYVIIDYYIDGGMKINPLDPIAYLYKKNDVKVQMANPLQVVSHSMNKLSSISGISSDFLVGIVLANDDANINLIENSQSNVNIVKLRDLSKFVTNYEKKPVSVFVPRQLWQAIQDLHTIKENVQSRNNKENK